MSQLVGKVCIFAISGKSIYFELKQKVRNFLRQIYWAVKEMSVTKTFSLKRSVRWWLVKNKKALKEELNFILMISINFFWVL